MAKKSVLHNDTVILKGACLALSDIRQAFYSVVIMILQTYFFLFCIVEINC